MSSVKEPPGAAAALAAIEAQIAELQQRLDALRAELAALKPGGKTGRFADIVGMLEDLGEPDWEILEEVKIKPRDFSHLLVDSE